VSFNGIIIGQHEDIHVCILIGSYRIVIGNGALDSDCNSGNIASSLTITCLVHTCIDSMVIRIGRVLDSQPILDNGTLSMAASVG